MNTTEQLANKIKAITVFLLQHRGPCFAGMDAAKLFRYVAFHLLHGCVFVAYDAAGNISTVFFAWPLDRAEMLRRDAAGEPLFIWEAPKCDGDAFFIGGIVGKRRFGAEVFKQVSGAWPESPRKQVFTFRKGKLVELSWKELTRFCGLPSYTRS